MKGSRLIKILRSFDRSDLKGLERFIGSPFNNSARNIAPLYSHLVKHHPDYTSDELLKERIFEKLFGGEGYNEKKLINLMSELTKSCEQYLALETYLLDESENLINLSRAFLKRGLLEESNRINKVIEKNIKRGFSPGRDYISKFRRLNFLKSIYYTQLNDFENLIETKKNYFEESALQFIIDYTDIVGSIIPAMNTYGKNIKKEFVEDVIQSFRFEKLVKSLEDSGHKNKDIILLHYYWLKANSDRKAKFYYYKFRDLLYEMMPQFEREEKHIMFNNLVHFCIANFEEPEREFKREILDVYKKMLEHEAYSLSEDEYMQTMTYRNIFFSCVTESDTVFLEYFVSKYTDKLKTDVRNDMSSYALGYLYYIKKEFETALEHLSKINQEFFLFKSDLKNLMLIIYYELNYFEQAFSMVDTYRHFLSNTKEITNSYKDIYRAFLKHYSGLLRIKCGQSKESPGYVINQIEKEKALVSKTWLINKAKELIM